MHTEVPSRWSTAPIAFLVLCVIALSGCRKEEKEEEAFVPNTGQIQILNGCGKCCIT